jgi:hypothetical protein
MPVWAVLIAVLGFIGMTATIALTALSTVTL